MKNTRIGENALSTLGLIALLAGPLTLGIVSNRLEHKRQIEREAEEAVWQTTVNGLREIECSNSVHYLNTNGYFMHGNTIEGLGWSEEFCKNYNRGAF